MLQKAVLSDLDQQKAIGSDPIRLPSAWLRRFLSGEFSDLDTAPPPALKAALAARERLRLVRRLRANIPALDDLRRRVGLAELLEPLRLLTGEQGGWDGTPRRDGFVGRDAEMRELRAFVDELSSRGAIELVARGITRAKQALTGTNAPGLTIVEAPGGLGKSTLLAKFVLDHALDQYRPFPFAYLDFDGAGIDPERPHQILIEIARQVGLQFPNAQPKLEALREDIRTELVRPPIQSGTSTASEIRDPFSQFTEILREYATFGSRAFLLVLDTLEVVQWNSSAMDKLAQLIDEFRRKGLDELRVVASGRADIPELQVREGARIPAVHIRLKPLLVKEARQMADALGKSAVGSDWNKAWSAAIAGREDQDDARREPLAVRVAVDLIAYADPSERRSIANELAEKGIDAELPGGQDGDGTAAEPAQRPKIDFVARLYERRIVNHVRDPNARKLAWPGLVVRRITLEMARELLATFCNIPATAAEHAFTALGQEIWMVTREGDALQHRPDLRARTLPLMRRKDAGKFDAIARAAVAYFAKHRTRSREDYVEWLYHRLLAGEPPEQVEPDIGPDVLPLLVKSEADFPSDSAAASYLAARTTRTRLSPRRIRALRANDALYHLSVTSAGAFALDDVSVDDLVAEVSDRLRASGQEIVGDLKPWCQALWIKTGAWPALTLPRGLTDDLSAVVRRAYMFWIARMSSTLDAEERAELAERYLSSFMRVSPNPERAGFRTTVQAMALACIADRADFAMLDAQVAGMLSKMRPDPLPSTQAALRTAIVFGEQSRVPAVHVWLASRRRGSSDRVRNPTVSLAELRGLARIRRNAGELRRIMKNAPDMPTRFAEDDIVSASGRVIDEIVGELADNAEGLRALARVFAVRDEDWIVPLGYAAARAYPTSFSGALSKRLDGYQSTSGSREAPDHMIGAMRLADEAGDLMGFCDFMLAEGGANASATTDLHFLVHCHGAWRRGMNQVLGMDDLAPIETTPVPHADRPPEPGPVLHPDDPQKDRWGGLEARDGRSARAILESVERDVFYFSVIVESTDGSPLKPPVVFHMHDTYRPSVVPIRHIVEGRLARLMEWNATGVFAVGIQVKDAAGEWTSLEVDLARLPSLPRRFLSR